MITYGRQFIDSKDIQAVTKALKSKLITQGPTILKFENSLKLKLGFKYAIALSSGTAALHLIGLAMGWKKGDVILTTPISFLATSNAIVYSGATPEFVDFENTFFNIDTQKLEKKIKDLKKKRKKIRAIICTDFAGHPCDWPTLKYLSNKYKLKLINDNCHSIGASINGDNKYSSKYSDCASLSFHPVKGITTGEGGAVLTNDKEIYEKIKMLRSHGVDRKKSYEPWKYDMKFLGFNYRITDFQCALGLSQLKKLNKFILKRKKIAKIYDKEFKNIKNISIPKVKNSVSHAYHLYPLKINFKKFNISKTVFFKKMKRRKILLQVHYIPIYLQSFYKKKFKYNLNDLKVSKEFYDHEVSLPIYYDLKVYEQKKVINSIKNILKI